MRKLRRQNDRLKTWKRTSAESDRKEYKLAKATAKKVVARVKAEAIDGLYDNMGTSEGQKDVYGIAAARDREGKDIGQIRTGSSKLFGTWAKMLSAIFNRAKSCKHGKHRIYTIIRLKSVSQATFADCRSQFLLDRLRRCLKLIVSYRGTSSHEFASQFGLAFFLYVKNIHKLSRMPTVAEVLAGKS